MEEVTKLSDVFDGIQLAKPNKTISLLNDERWRENILIIGTSHCEKFYEVRM